MANSVLIVLGGFAGAGKTTVSHRLAREFGLAVFSSDDINDGLRAILDKEFYEASPLSHRLLWFLLKKQLLNDASAILDSNMCSQASWDNLDILKRDFPNLLVLPILLKCSIEVHKQRIDYRGQTNKEHLNLGGDILEDVMFKYDFISKLRRGDLININAEVGADEVYGEVRRVILDATPGMLIERSAPSSA